MRLLNTATYLICYLSASWFQRTKFLEVISYIALYIHMTPWGVASLKPMGYIDRIYVGDHYTLLHTQYKSFGLMVSEKKIFFTL